MYWVGLPGTFLRKLVSEVNYSAGLLRFIKLRILLLSIYRHIKLWLYESK